MTDYVPDLQRSSHKTTLEQILLKRCKEYDMEPDELSNRSRQKRISEPRPVVALLVREIEHITLVVRSLRFERDLSGLSQAASRLEVSALKKRISTQVTTVPLSGGKNEITGSGCQLLSRSN